MSILSWAPPWALGSPREDVREAAGLPGATRCAKLYNVYCLLLRPAELLSPLSEISDKVPTICHNVFFPRKYQWLAQYCAPDCSHSHIVRAGRSRIILWIILLAFHPCIIVISGKPRTRIEQRGSNSYDHTALVLE